MRQPEEEDERPKRTWKAATVIVRHGRSILSGWAAVLDKNLIMEAGLRLQRP